MPKLTKNFPRSGKFPVRVLLAGKTHVRFHIDVGFGDPLIGSAEELVGDNVLDFTGLAQPRPP